VKIGTVDDHDGLGTAATDLLDQTGPQPPKAGQGRQDLGKADQLKLSGGTERLGSGRLCPRSHHSPAGQVGTAASQSRQEGRSVTIS